MTTKQLSFEEVKAIYTAHHDAFVEARRALPNYDKSRTVSLTPEEDDAFYAAESEMFLGMILSFEADVEGSGWDWPGFLEVQTEHYVESLKQMTEQEVIDLGDISCQ